MTSKLVVNTIESDTGISSVSFASSISMSSTSKFFFSAAGIDIGADTNINRPEAGVLGFNINGSEKVRINSSGQLGIGTVTPISALDVRGTTHALGNGGAALVWGNTTSLGTLSYSGTDAVVTATNNLLFNVGGDLEISTTTTTSPRYLKFNSNRSNADDTLGGIYGVWNGNSVAAINFKTGADTTNKDDGELQFVTYSGGTAYERLRIESDGELRITGTGDNNDPAHLRLHHPDTSIVADDAIGQIRFAGRDSGGATISRTGALIQATAAATWDTGQSSGYSATHLDFFTQNNSGTDTVAAGARLRISSTGSIGVGEADPSPHGGEYRGIDVGYKGSGITGRTGNPTFTMRSNIYYDGSNWKYGEGNTTAGVLSVGGAQLIFENAASGTAGATATITERLRIMNDGELRLSSENGNNSDTPGIRFRGGSSTQKANFARIHSRMVSNWGGQLQFKVKNDNGSLSDAYNTAMIMNHNAHVTKPNNPSFHIGSPYDSGASSGQVWRSHSNAIFSNVGSHYNNSNGRFTAPVDGQYFFFHWGMSNTSGQTNDVYSRLNGSRDQIGTSFNHSSGATHNQFGCSYIRTLSAGDYVDVYNTNGNIYATTDGRHAGWGGWLIG